MRKTVSIRFGKSPEEQKRAHTIMSAIREGELARMEGKPVGETQSGKPIYRFLIGGLPWSKTKIGYVAHDGDRQWRAVRLARGWEAGVIEKDKNQVLTARVLTAYCRTMREARGDCESAARLVPGPNR